MLDAYALRYLQCSSLMNKTSFVVLHLLSNFFRFALVQFVCVSAADQDEAFLFGLIGHRLAPNDQHLVGEGMLTQSMVKWF